MVDKHSNHHLNHHNHKNNKHAVIKIENLIKEFNAGEQTIRILHGINLTFYAGEMVAIIGQSGSGKSTLMNILGCLDQATAGTYHIYDKSVAKLSADELAKLRREHFGFIFQRYHLLGDLPAIDNVAIPAVYAGMATQTRKQHASHLLTQLGLADKIHNRPNQLSGGQQQRVSIARALMNGGDIIFADEPTGALDSESGHDVMAILHQLKEAGHTIIMVTHDPKLAAQAQRVIEIKDGHIIADHRNTPITQDNADGIHHAQRTQTQNSFGLTNPAHLTDVDTQSTSQPPTSQPTTSPPLTPSRLPALDRFKEAFKMSLLAMTAHKMRTLLTMLGIIIGIASVVSIVGLGQGSQQSILSQINALGTNTITVIDGYEWGDPRRAYHNNNLTADDAQAVAAQPYVQSVSPQVDTNLSSRHKQIRETASINGVGKDYLSVTGENLAAGQSFSQHSMDGLAQDIVIDQTAKTTFFGEGTSDDAVLGKIIQVGQVPARVIGVLAQNDNNFSRMTDIPQIYMPYTTVMHRILGKNNIDRFVVRINDDVSTKTAENAISDLMKSRHGTDDFRLHNIDSLKETVESTTTTMTLLISSIAIISLIVGGIGVMNIMLVSVTERTNEIGVRMAVGARQSDIMQQFLIEAVLVCLLGGLLGIGLAFLIGFIINNLGSDNIKVIYSTTSIVTAIVCSTAIGMLFGFLPARNAAKLNPVEALSRD